MARKLFSKLFAVSGAVTAVIAVLFALIVLNTTDSIGLTVSVIWMAVNLPAQLLSMIVHGDVHQTTGPGFYLGVAIEWFLIGYFVARFFYNRTHPDPPPTPRDAMNDSSLNTL